MPDSLAPIDGVQTLVADHPTGREYLLAARIDGLVARASAEQLGPALNALYAQTLAAVLADPTLGGLAMDVREGVSEDTEDTEGASLEIEVSREPFTAPTAAFGLHLSIPYWVPEGSPPQRDAILAALEAAATANVPSAVPSVREQVLAALRAHLAASLGGPVLRNADRPMKPGESPVILLDGEQSADHGTFGQTLYDTLVPIEVFVSGDASALDARVQLVLQALRSANTLGGLAVDVQEELVTPDVLREEYTGPALGARIEARIWFATVEHDPWTVA